MAKPIADGRGPRRARLALAAACVALALAGCGRSAYISSRMQEVGPSDVPPLAPDKARVVFIRPEKAGYKVSASVFEVTSGEPRFLGFASYGGWMYADVPAGDHRFMVISEAADFMGAHLAAGKTYYAMVKVRTGMFRARFSLVPITVGMRKHDPYREGIASGRWTLLTDDARGWARENDASIRDKMAAYLPRWEAKAGKPVLYENDGT